MNNDEKLALNNCDREPVHIPGRIQPFGCMLAFRLETGEVTHYSENITDVFETVPVLGSSYEDFIGDRGIKHAVRGALSLPTIRRQRDRVGVFQLDEQPVDVSVYATDTFGVVEFERDEAGGAKGQSPVSMVRSMMSAVQEGQGLDRLLESTVKALRHLTGHDRVMAYRFLDTDDGEVVAEAKGPGIDPYLGLRYPAWDIPTQVRQMMLRAPFRVIKDIHADHSALIQHPDVLPLDMTLSHLRGVSPIYIEYLTNMGVRATMNVSIIVRGRLWGMFAFHHYRPRQLTPDERSIVELFGQLVSMMIQKEEEQGKVDRLRRTQSTLGAIGETNDGIREVVGRMSESIQEATATDGLALAIGDSISRYGDGPDDQTISTLASMANQEIVAIDSLSGVPELTKGKHSESLGTSAGALVLRLTDDCQLMFFRNEVIHSIRWAGEKEKEIKVGPNGPRLTPRGSFAEYSESVRGRCEPWSPEDHAVAGEICRELWKVMQIDARTQSTQLERQKKYQDLLIAELNHRVRNTLALVRSIARQTQSDSVSLEQYVASLESRIAALSSAHDLIGGSGLQWARIGDLVGTELKPFKFEFGLVMVEGPEIAVRADVAPILALLFHELVSNAVKHGALSPNGERLEVVWREDAGGLLISWHETLKTIVSEPERRGFGIALIERALPYECQGWSKINFNGHNLEIQFWLPEEKVDRSAEMQTTLELTKPAIPKTIWKEDTTINSALVVEDNFVLAMEVERLLLDMGIASVDTVPNVQAAESAINHEKYDCAILDINLGDDTSFEIAARLIDAGTRVVFASGYDSKYELPEHLAHVPRVVKPINRVDVMHAMESAGGSK